MIPPIPDEKQQAFSNLPHKNPFFDIKTALRHVIPLNVSYSNSLKSTNQRQEKDDKVKTIEKAYRLLQHRQEPLFVKCFHRLSEEFLKEYGKRFPNKVVEALVSPRGNRSPRKSSHLDSPRVRDAIISQDVTVYAYFDNFYQMSERYLSCIEELDDAVNQKKKK